MRPNKAENTDPQLDMFKSELANIISPSHPLVRLAKEVSWEPFDEEFGPFYRPIGRLMLDTPVLSVKVSNESACFSTLG